MDYSAQSSRSSTHQSDFSIDSKPNYPPESFPRMVRTDEEYDTEYFKYIPASYDSSHLEDLIELEKDFFPPHFYSSDYVYIRTICAKRTKEELSLWPVKPHPPETYQKLFINNWEKLMIEKKKQLNLSDSQYLKSFYHPGEFAYMLLKFDALRKLMKTPVIKIKESIWMRKFGTPLPDKFYWTNKNPSATQQSKPHQQSEKKEEKKETLRKKVSNEKQERGKSEERNKNIKNSDLLKTNIKQKTKPSLEVELSSRLRRSVQKPDYNEQMKKPSIKPK